MLSQRVRSDLRVRELLASWAAYLERHDSNIAIDVQRIEWVRWLGDADGRLRSNGQALDADERLFNVPGCQLGHMMLQAARKPQQEQPVSTSTSVRRRDTNASTRFHHGHCPAAGRLHAAHHPLPCVGDG